MKILQTLLTLTIFATSFSYANVEINGDGSGGWGGYAGNSGMYGTDGGDGSSGGDGDTIDVTLRTDGMIININGTVGSQSVSKSLDSMGQLIHLSSAGGDGGSGGSGGNGINGADGVDGSSGHDGHRGRRGRDGRDGTRNSPNGGGGGDGGRGGDGGNGEDGTDGRDGGHGGNGGDGAYGGGGGKIIVRYIDPSVLMHVRASFSGGDGGSAGWGGRAGSGGSGGSGGRAGYSGSGGRGGNGGTGYTCTPAEVAKGCTNGSNGYDGSRGRRGSSGWAGKDGSDGYDGSSGNSGSYGGSGFNGTIKLLQIDASGTVISQSDSMNIYRLKVDSFEVIDGNNDGIFEPGEKISIKNILIKNEGGLDMPIGGQFELEGLDLDQSVLELPLIKKGGSFTITQELSGIIPADYQTGKTIEVTSKVSFRGLNFKSDNSIVSLDIQYPLQITGVDFQEYIPFNKTFKAIITVKNISRANYSTIDVKHILEGEMQYSITQKLTSVAAGQSGTETIEYSIANSSRPFHRSDLNFSVYRETFKYQSSIIKAQVVPTYVYSTSSQVLIISNGQSADSYAAIVAGLTEMGEAFDIFDMNLQGEISIETLQQYEGKIVFLPHFKGVLSDKLISMLANFSVKSGGLFTANLKKEIDSQNYLLRVYQDQRPFFDLSMEEQSELTKIGVMDVMSFSKKSTYLDKYYKADQIELANLLKEALVRSIQEEHLLAEDDDDIYDKPAIPLALLYDQYAQQLNASTEFSYRAFILNFVADFLKFKDEIDGPWRKFKKFIKPSIESYEQVALLEESCGDLRGTYIDVNGRQMFIKKKIFSSKYRVKLSDSEMKFKGKKLDDGQMLWALKYKIDDVKHVAKFSMTCQGVVIRVKAELPSYEGNPAVWNFVKMSTDD